MKKILIIEDNDEVRENLAEILTLSGYQTIEAENGTSGVELAQLEEPNLILCDVMMPKLDGYGVLKILRGKSETADTPFVFLTAKAEKEDFRRGMNLGADDYIQKPFFKDELLRVIDVRLKKDEHIKNKFDKTEKIWLSFLNDTKGYEKLIELAENSPLKQYNKKRILFEEGKNPRNLFCIKSGTIKIYKTNEFGKEFILSIRRPGELIGFSSLINNAPYNFSAASLTPIEVYEVGKEDFLKLFFSNNHTALHIIKLMSQNIAQKETQLLSLAYDSVRKRVANSLLFLQKKLKIENPNSIAILREDLAHIVGTAKESVIRMLTEFKEDGYIDIQEGKIIIIDQERLERIV